MKPWHWDSLIASIRHGQCILVPGPEIPAAPAPPSDASASARFSCNEALILHLLSRLGPIDTAVGDNSVAAVAQSYEDSRQFGSNVLRSCVEQFYQRQEQEYLPSKAHRLIGGLPFSLILTTAHDDLLERALRNAGKSPSIERYHFRGDRRDNGEFMIPGAPDHPLFGTACSAIPRSRALWCSLRTIFLIS